MNRPLVVALVGVLLAAAPALAADSRCDWTPAATEQTVTVATVPDLVHAVRNAASGTTIEIEDGRYLLPHSLDFRTPDVVLVGKRRDASRVLLHGTGMTERKVGVALSVSAPRITIAYVTIGKVGYHGIQIRGEKGASNATVFGVRIFDTGQQLLKGSISKNGRYADGGLVACSTFEYTHHAPSDYTNAIDVLAAKGWVVRDNRIHRIRGPRDIGWKAGPAILFWANSIDTRIEGNVVSDSYRGIALGLGPGYSSYARGRERTFDHQGGSAVRNVVVNLNDWADEGIEINAARGVRVEHNRVFVKGRLPWSISVRFRSTTATVRNNVTNRPIVARNGARLTRSDNTVRAKGMERVLDDVSSLLPKGPDWGQ